MSREKLIEELNSRFAGLLDAVGGLSAEQMTQQMYGEWSVRDILAHIAGWHREMTKAFERIARGERPVPEDVDYSNFDSWNANFAGDSRDASPGDVLAEVKESQGQFAAAALSVPEDRFEEGRAAHRIIFTTGIDHYAEHEPAIREWRQREGI
jgi:hypothetical protein